MKHSPQLSSDPGRFASDGRAMRQPRTPLPEHKTFSEQHKAESNCAEIKRNRKREQEAEEALRESQARLAGIIDSAMDAIITVDEKQQSCCRKMVYCSAEEAIGANQNLRGERS